LPHPRPHRRRVGPRRAVRPRVRAAAAVPRPGARSRARAAVGRGRAGRPPGHPGLRPAHRQRAARPGQLRRGRPGHLRRVRRRGRRHQRRRAAHPALRGGRRRRAGRHRRHRSHRAARHRERHVRERLPQPAAGGAGPRHHHRGGGRGDADRVRRRRRPVRRQPDDVAADDRRLEAQGTGMTLLTRSRRGPARDRTPTRDRTGAAARPDPLDVQAIRKHFAFPEHGRIVTNNAASTQPSRELLALQASLAPGYENVHRGQSTASRRMTAQFEASYDTIAEFIGAPGRSSIALYKNTTEAINAVMYSLLTEFRDGDNVVTTTMEHNSNYVPWYAMCREILPRLGRRVQYRLARFDPDTGELDLAHLASLIDARTKLVGCTGASNFLGTRNPLAAVKALADASGYCQPNGERRSYLLVDAAQLVPGSFVDVQALGVDYL